MLISRKYNFLFVHIYKNAGTSITKALRPFVLNPSQRRIRNGLKKIGAPFSFFDPQPFPDNIKASEIIDFLCYEKFKSFYSFAIVRNPWDWQVSLYNYMLKTESHNQHELVKDLGSFEKYIEWRCENEIRFQRDFIYSENNELLVNFVGKFESLDADFKKICSNIGISTSLPKLNVSNSKPYQNFYTERTEELVRKSFQPDIETFNYEF